MNIWFAAAVPNGSNGGVNRVMAELSAALSDRGHQCVTIDSGTSSARVSYLFFAFRLFLRFVSSLGNRPDWIVARSTDGFLCALAVRMLGIKTCVALHSHGWEEKVYEVERLVTDEPVVPRTTWKARWIRFVMLRWTLALCNVCICGTMEETRWVRNRYRRFCAKVACVPNGVSSPGEACWTIDKLAPTRFLAVGGATWKKNVQYTLSIFRRVRALIPEAALTVIGGSPGELGITVDDLRNGMSAVRSEPPAAMDRWYSACPYFISSSRYEGGRSLALLEAMAHGCVVFVSAIPSSLECVHHGKNGFVLSGDNPAADARIVVDAIATPDACATAGGRAFLFAKRQSWQRQAARLERIVCKP